MRLFITGPGTNYPRASGPPSFTTTDGSSQYAGHHFGGHKDYCNETITTWPLWLLAHPPRNRWCLRTRGGLGRAFRAALHRRWKGFLAVGWRFDGLVFFVSDDACGRNGDSQWTSRLCVGFRAAARNTITITKGAAI